jgi:hypothetical protein
MLLLLLLLLLLLSLLNGVLSRLTTPTLLHLLSFSFPRFDSPNQACAALLCILIASHVDQRATRDSCNMFLLPSGKVHFAVSSLAAQHGTSAPGAWTLE